MAQTTTSPKIEELRFKVKADPKSRLFFPLAEELRKLDQFAEAEQVLRNGLTHHPTYLSGWVGLGRTLAEQGKHREAIDSLNRAMQLDGGNVVAARLVAESYLALGEKVEAIKKYKLVHALLPSDEELELLIAKLDAEINGPKGVQVVALSAAPEETVLEVSAAPKPPAPLPAAAAPPAAPVAPPASSATTPMPDSPFDQTQDNPFGEASAPSVAPAETETSPWGNPEPAAAEPVEIPAATPPYQPPADSWMEEDATRDAEPMLAAHSSSPFEESVSDSYGAAAFEVESPRGMQIEEAPPIAEFPRAVVEEGPGRLAAVPSEDPSSTETMADLYVGQGLSAEARTIYESILSRDPGNQSVRRKLDALSASGTSTQASSPSEAAEKVARLERWLSRVTRREGERV